MRNHSQTQHESSHEKYFFQTQAIWEKACLVITHCEWECSSIQMKRDGSCNSLDSNHPSQSLSTHPHSQSQSQSSQKRNNDPSSTILNWDNTSNWTDDLDHRHSHSSSSWSCSFQSPHCWENSSQSESIDLLAGNTHLQSPAYKASGISTGPIIRHYSLYSQYSISTVS